MIEWQNPSNGRWYTARFATDLFDTPCILMTWGGARPSRGRQRLVPVEVDAESAMADLERRRSRRGYVRTRCP